MSTPPVAIIMGSQSDWPTMKHAADILDELGQVAEGVMTARSAYNLGRKVGVDMPITREVYAMLYEEKPVPEALSDLLGRQRKAELD